MKILSILHFYQPHNQQLDILDRIVNECYRPLIKGLLKRKSTKLVINISGALTKMLVENGYWDVVEGIKELLESGRAEMMGSAMYHAFLPLLPESEIERQIDRNIEVNRKYFGNKYDPTGFFPPEMAVNKKVLDIAKRKGYKWIAAPQMACREGAKGDRIYVDEDTGLNVFFRNKRVSALILSAVIRRVDDFIRETKDLHGDLYWVTVMDAETFGHHRIGHEKLLFELLDADFIKFALSKELLNLKIKKEKVKIRPSTWTNEEQDFWLDKKNNVSEEDRAFVLWNDIGNPIHKLQWELTNLAMKAVDENKGKGGKRWNVAREMLDFALASDQYWWSSANPWWSLEMIEQGAYVLKDVIFTVYTNNTDSSVCAKADELYRKILDKAFLWQREGIIRKMHLENSSTYMREPFSARAPSEWYNQIILEFEDQMCSAAKSYDYERAIKWRDAVEKLKQGTDIYDVLHVVDELWSARDIPSVKPFLKHKWSELSKFAKENIKGVKSKDDFEKWKKDCRLE